MAIRITASIFGAPSPRTSSPFWKRVALNWRANNPMPGPFAKLPQTRDRRRDMTPRPMAFPARATPRTPTRPTADDGPNDKPPPPKPDVPQSGKSRQTRGFGIPANAAEQTSRLRPHSPLRSSGHGRISGNHRKARKTQDFGIPANAAQTAAFGLTARPGHFRS